MAARGSGRAEREKGVSTVEVVVLTPVIFIFAVTMVGLALFAQNVSQVQQAASDAARMASLQSSGSSDDAAAVTAATADLGSTCDNTSNGPALQVPAPTAAFSVADAKTGTSVAMLQATVTCRVKEFGFSYTITASSYAPVDTYGGEQR